jgi:sugar/nucleoside kinase (ribokinase family)
MRESNTGSPLFLCVGDIDVDVLVQVDRLPTRDGKVNGSLLQRAPGGMAGNVSVALSRLGARVRIMGRVGDDPEAEFALEALSRAGVDIDFVVHILGARTFSCISLLTPDGEKSLIKLMTSAYRPGPADLSDLVYQGVSHVHLTSAGDSELCRRVIELAHDHGATASLDIEKADCPGNTMELLKGVNGFDLVFCNSESREFVDATLGRPLDEQVPTVITTQGATGSEVETKGVRFFSPGFDAKVVDTTGAGDCFAAAFLYARLMSRLDWVQALRFANKAAAMSTTGLGAQSALPTADEVLAKLSGS